MLFSKLSLSLSFYERQNVWLLSLHSYEGSYSYNNTEFNVYQ